MKDRRTKDGKNKMIPDEASTANLPNINIIFYPVGGKNWQNMMK